MLPHTSFNGSQLIRALEKLDLAAAAPPSQNLAEALSQWLDWTDAIALATALPASTPAPPASRPVVRPGAAGSGRRFDALALVAEFGATRDDLARAISSDPVFAAENADAVADPTSLSEPGLSTLRRRYLEHQRAMETRVAALRAKLRAALSKASPELASLAALDAAMDSALAGRERHLLAGLPVLLGRQFERRFAAAAPADSGEPPALRHAEPGRQMKAVLLAELEFRLQPLAGMIETLDKLAGTDSKAGSDAARTRKTAEQP